MQQKEHQHFQHQNTCLQGQHGQGRGLGAAAKFQIIHSIPDGRKNLDFIKLVNLLNPDALKLNKIFQDLQFNLIICKNACIWLIQRF